MIKKVVFIVVLILITKKGNSQINCNSVQNAMPGQGSQAACFCIPAYTWNSITKTCMAPPDCSNVNYSSKIPDSAGGCNCIPGFYWKRTFGSLGVCQRNCSNISFTRPGDSQKSQYECNCLDGYSWTGVVCNFQGQNPNNTNNTINCNAILNTLGNNGTTACFCAAKYLWMTGLNQCYLNCGIIPNVANPQPVPSGSSCQCVSGMTWNSGQLECTFNNFINTTVICLNMPNSNGQSDGFGGCICNSGFNFINGACRINCSNILNNAGPGFTADSCNCISSFAWNGKQCVFQFIVPDCSTLPGANGSLNGVCTCYVGYTWTGSQCLYNNASGYLNCYALPNTLQFSPYVVDSNNIVSPYSCNCRQYYYWNNSTGSCAVNCSLVANNNGNADSTNCNCLFGYTWNSTLAACVSGSGTSNITINCNNINNSAGNINDTTCSCQYGYYWSNSVCMRNCSQVNNSTGSNSNNNFSECVCNTGYTYQNSECVLNCSNVSGSNGSFNASSGGCSCKYVSYVWTGSSCTLNCSYASYTKNSEIKQKDDGSECNCHGGYKWDKIFKNCRSKTGNKGLAIGLGVGLGVGIPLLLALLGLLSYYLCCKGSSTGLATVTPVMLQPAPITPAPVVTRTIQKVVQPNVVTSYRTVNAAPPPPPAYTPPPPAYSPPPPPPPQLPASSPKTGYVNTTAYVQSVRQGPPIVTKVETLSSNMILPGQSYTPSGGYISSQPYIDTSPLGQYSGNLGAPGTARNASTMSIRGLTPPRR